MTKARTTHLSPDLLHILGMTKFPLRADPTKEAVVRGLNWLVSRGLVKRTKISADAKLMWPELANRPFSYKWTEAGGELYHRLKRQQNAVFAKVKSKRRV